MNNKGGLLMKTVSLRFFAPLVLLVWLIAACGGAPGSSTTSPAAAPSPTHAPMMMNLPAYAKDYKISITAPASGTKVTANTVTVTVAITGYTPTCALAGKADQAGAGHYHILLDKSLVNMYCQPSATISLQNVAPGMHTLTAVPTLNDHTEIEENATSITVDYEPTNALPAITNTTFTSPPSITI